MKTLNKNSIMVGMLLGSMVIAGGAVAGIASTKHNLGTTNILGSNQNDATGEVCVFCHTPHGSVTTASVPLWNKTLPLANTYDTYDTLGTSSLDGGITTVGSVSIACLSCHDGSQSMDVMVNTPGSGTDVSGALGGGWTGGTVTAAGVMTAGANGSFPMLGTDLTNDHPIGIQYAGGGITDTVRTPATTVYGDEDFNVPDVKDINGVPTWYIETGGNTKRNKTDLPLYTRTDTVPNGFAGEPEPFVECASCHDPHTETVTFLRISNLGSAVCLACHDK